MGLLPLTKRMPVRVTQTLPSLKKYNVYKNTRGRLCGWCVTSEDEARIENMDAMELVLTSLPVCLYVQIEGATWTQNSKQGAGVIKIKPIQQHWKVVVGGKATVCCRGFPVACDLAGTAHSFQGSTLEACTIDLGLWNASGNHDSQLAGYMCMSRVRRTEDLCIARPYSPNLFAQGDLLGPQVFLNVHRQTVTLSEAEKIWNCPTKRKPQRELLLACRLCSSVDGAQEILKKFGAFVTPQSGGAQEVVKQGMDRICLQCLEKIKRKQRLEVDTEETMEKCAWCGLQGSLSHGFCTECLQTKHLTCKKCLRENLALSEFDAGEVQTKKQTKELRRLHCLRCMRKRET